MDNAQIRRQPEAMPEPSSSRIHTVLVVDDDEDSLQLLVFLLTKAGVPRVLTSGTVADAKSCMATMMPDVLITDIRLEDSNGLELVVRAQTMYPQMTTIVFTGFDDPVLRHDAERFGARFFLKPINPDELLQAIPACPTRGVAASPALVASLPHQSQRSMQHPFSWSSM